LIPAGDTVFRIPESSEQDQAAYALMQSIHNQAAGGAILYSALDNNCGHMSCYVLQAVGNDTPLDLNDSLITPASFLDAARQLSDWIMITDGSASKCNWAILFLNENDS
jgi:hypothetical protein